jgi:uncharacterized protein YjiS (DUF1127 family)
MPFTEISRSVASVFDRLMLWAERASQRRLLSELDDNMLRDIGLTRHDAFAESVRPFWSGAGGVSANHDAVTLGLDPRVQRSCAPDAGSSGRASLARG